MLQKELNLGIVAHVDAGKTTLTERLLYRAGVVGELGSVDAGTTQTDSLELERRRGITIKSAVASFALEEVHVNLIDTPGHPDFIAEVERVLGVLDGAVLVVSAVEGVQPQTRILMRALQRLEIPTLLFVNKIDRPGATYARVLEAVSERLTAAIVPMGTVRDLGSRDADFVPFGTDDLGFGTRLAEVLAQGDNDLLAAYVEDEAAVSAERLRAALVSQTKRGLVHPVFFGSALTGAGMETLAAGLGELLPTATGDHDGPVRGVVFKIERVAGRTKAYVRMFSGTLRTRDRVVFGPGREGKVTNVAVFEQGSAAQRPLVAAGAVAKLEGLAGIRIGDAIGEVGTHVAAQEFPPPALESVVVSRRPEDRARLRVALAELAEQDPLINVRQNDALGEISVSLYGEVQKEVIGETLERDFGVEVEFRETTTIYVERPSGTGEALEILHATTPTNVTGKSSPTSSNPYLATLGLRVDRAPTDSGVEFRCDVGVRLLPIYIYKSIDAFIGLMDEYVREALREGLYGWRVTDCTVTMTDCGYKAPGTTAADFRMLTALVITQALERAGTEVCEPTLRLRIEIPTRATGAVVALLARLGASSSVASTEQQLTTLEATLPAARAHEVQRQLPALTAGEGVLESSFAGYKPLRGAPP